MIDIDRRAFFAYLGGAAAVAGMSAEARADALENFLAATTAAAFSSALRVTMSRGRILCFSNASTRSPDAKAYWSRVS